MKSESIERTRSGAGLGSGRCATAAIYIAFGAGVARDLADVSVNDYFGLVIRLFGFLFRYLFSGFRFTFHALSPSSVGSASAIDSMRTLEDLPKGLRKFFLPQLVVDDSS